MSKTTRMVAYLGLSLVLLLVSMPSSMATDPLEPDCRWELFLHDDFAHGAVTWSNCYTSQCGFNNVLGGYGSRRVARPQGDTYTHVTGIPQHTHIRIKASYYFLDSWDAEFGFLKLDDRIVWTRDCYGCYGRGQNFCGAHWADQLADLIDIVIPHRRSSLKVNFGSNLDESTQNESYAIGNFMVYFFDCEPM